MEKLKYEKIKRIAIFLLLAAVVFVSSRTAVAYYTSAERNKGGLSVGENTIEIVEDFEAPETLKVGDNTFKKSVQIKNTGTIPCFVRVFADFSNYDLKDISEISSDGSIFYPADEYSRHLPSGWVYIEDVDDPLLEGYYYYTEMLPVNDLTPVLFKSVNTKFDTEEDIDSYDIIVYGESIQIKNDDGQDFTGTDTWKQAWTEFLSVN